MIASSKISKNVENKYERYRLISILFQFYLLNFKLHIFYTEIYGFLIYK
jgi:hypothetical protein